MSRELSATMGGGAAHEAAVLEVDGAAETVDGEVALAAAVDAGRYSIV
jgi:hypothetical protein